MKISLLILSLILFQSCNSTGGGSSSSISSNPYDCSPKFSGPTTSSQICLRNQQVDGLCINQGSPCRQNCNLIVQQYRSRGISGGVVTAAVEQCNRGCDSEKAACLYQNYYIEGTDCNQPVVEIIDPKCVVQTPTTTGSETNGTSNGGIYYGGTSAGVTTTGGTTTGGTTTGGTTTGGTTTGGTTTGGTTTGGTTTGGTTTGGTTTGGTTTGGTTTALWTSVAVSNPDPSLQAPTARRSHTAIWTGSEMIIWGGSENYTYQGNITSRNTKTGGKYNPAMNTWIGLQNQAMMPTTRDGHTAIWTGSEMIIWGGYQDNQQTSSGFVDGGPTNTGSSYNPAMNFWNPTSITNGPSQRGYHSAVWTGTRMLIWGGKVSGSNSFTNSGSSYNPTTATWTSFPNPNESNAPSPRWQHTAIWTGTEMIIWGGATDDGATSTNTGGRFNPATNTWTELSTDNAPTPRYGHTAIWTGSEMIVWGGNGRTGGRYDPSTDTWLALPTLNAPVGRGSRAVWTGTEMIVWGGAESDGVTLTYANSGARYNPTTNTWIPLSNTNAPSARNVHSAIWTGSEMIIWGGGKMSTGVFVNTGGKFTP